MFVVAIKGRKTHLSVAVFMKLWTNVDDSEFKKSAGSWQTVICDIIKTVKQQAIVLRRLWRFRFRSCLSGLIKFTYLLYLYCSGDRASTKGSAVVLSWCEWTWAYWNHSWPQVLSKYLLSGSPTTAISIFLWHTVTPHALLLPLKPSIF